jgi:hypothetical protein
VRIETTEPEDGPRLMRILAPMASLRAALGTGSDDLVEETLTDLAKVTSGDPKAISGALALIEEIRPQSPVEIRLMAQMAGAHAGAVRALEWMQRITWPHAEPAEAMGRLASRFMTVYALQAAALAKLRRTARASPAASYYERLTDQELEAELLRARALDEKLFRQRVHEGSGLIATEVDAREKVR